jgi:preprotein translocase subunit SecD
VRVGPSGLAHALWVWTLGIAVLASIAVVAADPLVLEVVSAKAGFDQRTKEPIVSYKLTESSARSFADLTAQNVGRKTELRVDGRVIMKPVIREPILGGSGQLSGSLTLDEAKDIAERLSAGSAKIEVELVPD